MKNINPPSPNNTALQSARTHPNWGAYGEQFASETLVLIPAFLQDIATFAEVLEKKLGKDSNDVSEQS